VTNTTLTPKSNTIPWNQWMNQPSPGPRFMMWIDGVGGFLTTLSERVRIGQAVPGTPIEIPVIGDLSRHHATIARHGEGYVIEPMSATQVGARSIDGPHNLIDGDVIRLGKSFVMKFRQPHPLSHTARLEFLSHHRTQPAADGVVMMAGSLILGPSTTSHVWCRSWCRDVVLVRQGRTLACHAGCPVEVDAVPYEGRAAVTLDSTIRGDDFCISLERID
jgi:hypothetical protein